MVSADGAQRWKTVLDQAPTALAVSPEGLVAVGDGRGGLTLCSAGGRVAWSVAAGDFPITAVGFAAADAVVAVDSRVGVGVFNREGRLFRRFSLDATAGPIRAIVATPGAVDFVSDAGRVIQARGIAPLPAGDLRSRAAGRILGTGLLVLAAILFGVAGSPGGASRLAALRARAAAGRHGYLLILPTFALLAVFCYYPMASALGYSFGSFSLTAPWEFAGLGNFREMAGDPYLVRSVVNMLILLATGLLKMIALPLLAAELVFWLPSERWQRFFRAAVIFPAVVPGVVLALVWKMIYDPYNGLINVSLRALGWGGAAHAWLGDERFALASVVFYNFPWINLLIFLIFLGGLIQVDRSVFEAVEMDGATILQRFRNVDLPALRPQMNVAITLIFIWSVQDFASVLILTGGGPGMATYVPALQMFMQISDGHNLGYSSAIGLVLFLAVVAFTLAVRKLNREEET
jgi:raffinose/stachyose/melibiose transport system permease protein